METYTLKVDPENNDLRLDIYLARNLVQISSRTFAQRLIDLGQVQVNRRTVKAHHHVLSDDEVTVCMGEEDVDHLNLKAEDISLDIFYEDSDILIINKPVGMLVHPVRGAQSGTLVNALLHYCRTLSDVNAPTRPGIVHRLDRETSGLMVVAKNNRAHVRLARQFEKHKVYKKYLAIVQGQIEFDEGLIEAPLGRHPRHHDKRAVGFDDEAKVAKTFYRVIKRYPQATYVALFPKTGRTHQLRVHMAYLGHTILGDDKYGKKESFPRLALHAQAIGFVHPTTSAYVEFSSIPPSEFKAFLES